MDLNLIGVVGAGVMGKGLAQDLAQTGHRVILVDLTRETLERAKREIGQNVRLHALFRANGQAESPAEVLARVTLSTSYDSLAEVDYLIENVTEKWNTKAQLYTHLDAICAAHCVFAANTSCISITRLASLTKRPSQFVGIHFMNPVPLKSTVEVIRGYHTSQETMETTHRLLTQMNKEGIVVKDSPGFVSNRVLMLTINEAIYLLQEQVASAKEIDQIFKSCIGHKMGPLETADLIGLDTILYSVEVLYDSFSDSKFRPCPLLRKMVDAGLLGQKSGQGFYHYAEGNFTSVEEAG